MGSTCSRIILNQKFINPKTFKTNVRRFSGLSYIHNVGKDPLKAQTIGQLFEESASKYGDKIAITSVYDNRKITFEEIFKESNKLAAGLHSLGLKKGDRVGLWAPNIIEWVTMMVAISQAGLITVALNPIDHQKNELEYFINKAGLKALVCPDEYKKLKFYDTLCSFLPELEKSDPGKLRSKRVPTLESVITISKNLYRGTYNYNEILNMCDEEAVNNLVKNNIHCPDAISNIQYTSGTTGISKAACVGHFQQVNNSYHIGKRSGLNPNENICVQVPFFHAFGTVVCVLAAQHFGSMLTLPSPVYNSSANLKALEDEKCTSVYGTPTMFVDLLNLQKKKRKN
ncbi:hypothetical protein RN001_012151 [Aquatica leii]|uniref:Medium-chain acyl-CoA ligase ACSF2, mitochondrial n=1 Tax=Aquatica leii TaxID=1421715 RepID=A0AAN7SF11_9COLE|nr:hypothetical protein RN001_012151 [Aquatica leii]